MSTCHVGQVSLAPSSMHGRTHDAQTYLHPLFEGRIGLSIAGLLRGEKSSSATRDCGPARRFLTIPAKAMREQVSDEYRTRRRRDAPIMTHPAPDDCASSSRPLFVAPLFVLSSTSSSKTGPVLYNCTESGTFLLRLSERISAIMFARRNR